MPFQCNKGDDPNRMCSNCAVFVMKGECVQDTQTPEGALYLKVKAGRDRYGAPRVIPAKPKGELRQAPHDYIGEMPSATSPLLPPEVLNDPLRHLTAPPQRQKIAYKGRRGPQRGQPGYQEPPTPLPPRTSFGSAPVSSSGLPERPSFGAPAFGAPAEPDWTAYHSSAARAFPFAPGTTNDPQYEEDAQAWRDLEIKRQTALAAAAEAGMQSIEARMAKRQRVLADNSRSSAGLQRGRDAIFGSPRYIPRPGADVHEGPGPRRSFELPHHMKSPPAAHVEDTMDVDPSHAIAPPAQSPSHQDGVDPSVTGDSAAQGVDVRQSIERPQLSVFAHAIEAGGKAAAQFQETLIEQGPPTSVPAAEIESSSRVRYDLMNEILEPQGHDVDSLEELVEAERRKVLSEVIRSHGHEAFDGKFTVILTDYIFERWNVDVQQVLGGIVDSGFAAMAYTLAEDKLNEGGLDNSILVELRDPHANFTPATIATIDTLWSRLLLEDRSRAREGSIDGHLGAYGEEDEDLDKEMPGSDDEGLD